MKVDNDPGKKKMSSFGSEEDLLAQLMGQGEVTKTAPGAVVSSVAVESTEEDDVPLRARAHQRKRKAVASSGHETALVSATPVSGSVTLTGLQVGEHVEVVPSKRVKAAGSRAPAPAQRRLKAIAEDARLEDEGFIRHVAGRLKHAGLDRVSQVVGSPKENRAKAFDAVLRGLHNLYLVDELEEDFTLKEQVAALEAGLMVEKTERVNATRQRDAAREKLEKLSAELTKVKDRSVVLERDLAAVPALKEEVSILKDKVASIPEVVERERKEAVNGFQISEEFLRLKEEAHGIGFKEGYAKNFRTLSERGWINREKYFADIAREKEEKRLREEASGGRAGDLEEGEKEGAAGSQEVVEEEVPVEEEEALRTPVRSSGEISGVGVKDNGDPFTPGVTPVTGGAQL